VGLAVERFDHIVLNCCDIEATASWYERVLGMRRETFGPSHRTALCFGDQKINLRPIGALADDPDWVTDPSKRPVPRICASSRVRHPTRSMPSSRNAESK
jgi:catechol 2,3-dioxygenase-like lactoylglutathione lyase family enzyme